jgi:hypothetical protein
MYLLVTLTYFCGQLLDINKIILSFLTRVLGQILGSCEYYLANVLSNHCYINDYIDIKSLWCILLNRSVIETMLNVSNECVVWNKCPCIVL